jgi:hypothetical protein
MFVCDCIGIKGLPLEFHQGALNLNMGLIDCHLKLKGVNNLIKQKQSRKRKQSN